MNVICIPRPSLNSSRETVEGIDGHFPFGNDACRGSASEPAGDANSVSLYAHRIRTAWRASTRAILKVAEIISEAKEALGPSECTRLAELIKLSLGSLSKLQKIHAERARFEPCLDQLPSKWTTLYELACLTETQFKRLLDEGRVRPDLTADTIKRTLTEHSELKVAITRSTPVGSTDDHATGDRSPPRAAIFQIFATVKTPANLGKEAADRIRGAILQALSGQPAQVEFLEDKAECDQKWRAETAAKLRDLLRQQLAGHEKARGKLTDAEYEVLENAAWQHQHKHQKGHYPYPRSDRNSIEQEGHPYSIYVDFGSRECFLAHVKEKKVISTFSPIEAFEELGEARCIKHALEYCEAASAKVRKSAKQHLQTIVDSEPQNADHANKYLDLIEKKGVL